MNKILYFDAETSGLDYKIHGLIELAFIVEINGDVVAKNIFFMNPIGKEIDPKAMAIHGLSIEDIRDFPSGKETYLKIIAFFNKFINKFDSKSKFIIAGHNVPFDIDFLRQLFLDNGDKFMGSYIDSSIILDSYRLIPGLQWAGKLPKLANLKLETICDYFDVDLAYAHDAMADITATRECLIKIKHFLKET